MKGESTVRLWRRLVALGCAGVACVALVQPALAQSNLFFFVPIGNSVSPFTTNAGAVPTSIGPPISGGASSGGFQTLVRGDQAFAYQSYSNGTDSIQVIDTATQSVVQTLVTGNVDPQGMVFSPNGSTLYVANNRTGTNTVSVYSVNAISGMLTQTGTIAAGTQPRALAISPDGSTLYVVNQTGNNVSVVSTATNAITATFAVGSQPISIAINAAGTRLYVGNAGSQSVTVIDTANNSVVTTVATSVTSNAIAVSRNGQFFYVVGSSSNQGLIYNATSNALVGTFSSASSPNGLVISPDGSTLYVTNGGSSDGQAFSIDASTGLLTSLGSFSTGGLSLQPGMCGSGSSAAGMMAGGATFLATSNGALGCAGSSATMTGGTIVAGVNNLTMNTPIVLASQGGTVNTNGLNLTLGGAISGTGGLTKTGLGILTLAGNSTYSGATLVNMGTLQAGIANAFSASSAYTVASGAILGLNGFNQTIGSLAGAGAVTLGGATLTTGNDNTSTTFSGTISGAGGLTKIGTGVLTLAGANTFTGGTTLNAGGLIVSGSLAAGVVNNGGSLLVSGSVAGTVVQSAGSTVLSGGTLGAFMASGGTVSLNGTVAGTVNVNNGATLSGNGTFGGLAANGATLAPGNSIGTFTVNGNVTQVGGVYQVEVNPQGQSDQIVASGTATINGGTVQMLAQSGTYARNTTYTILRANGGVSGTYSSVTSNFAFLTPSLSYDANDVFLTLAIPQNAFSIAGTTPNQKAVGAALDASFANATGDFATVIGALAGLSTAQAPAVLDALSGQQYADFGTMNTNNAAMFMNAIGQQMASARAAASSGTRQALAEACEIESCDGASPWSAWANALGGLGSVLGDGNAGTLTYNFGGAAAGVDYRIDPRFLVGIGTGYTHSTEWVNGFMGQGWSDSVSVAAYGSFTQAGFYADALAGYAYFSNRLQRQIAIPGLQQRTASGSTGANQVLGQVETGYKLAAYAPAQATVTPFARLQVSNVSQNAFSESGAQSLDLNVAQQATNSLRTTFGADLAGEIGLGNTRTLGLDLRLGWQHEYDYTGRPITAALSGAPFAAFTVYGVTPQRDSAVVGFSAATTIAEATQLYLRYDGAVGGGTDNHAVNLGVRFSW